MISVFFTVYEWICLVDFLSMTLNIINWFRYAHEIYFFFAFSHLLSFKFFDIGIYCFLNSSYQSIIFHNFTLFQKNYFFHFKEQKIQKIILQLANSLFRCSWYVKIYSREFYSYILWFSILFKCTNYWLFLF